MTYLCVVYVLVFHVAWCHDLRTLRPRIRRERLEADTVLGAWPAAQEEAGRPRGHAIDGPDGRPRGHATMRNMPSGQSIANDNMAPFFKMLPDIMI